MKPERTENTAPRSGRKRVAVRGAIALLCTAFCAVAIAVAVGMLPFGSPTPFGSYAIILEGADSTTDAPSQAADFEASADQNALGGAVNEPVDAAEITVNESSRDSRPAYVADEVLLVVDPSLTVDQANAYLQSADFTVTKSVTADDIAKGFLQLKLADGVSVEDALARIEQAGTIGAAQPNFLYYIQDETPAQPSSLAAGTSALLTTQDVAVSSVVNDNLASQQWALDAMHVPDAWQTLLDKNAIFNNAKANGAIGVAVIDEGFNVNHEDLKNVIVAQYNAADGGRTVSEVSGQRGHGTHVAGIVGAQANNTVGVAGVSHNAKLVLVKAYSESSSGISTTVLANAFDYVMSVKSTYNIRVINMSLGGPVAPESQTDQDKLLFTKIDNAYSNGIVTVCSAGNYSTPQYNYPSDYPTAVSVINVTNGLDYPRASTSNYNDASANDGAGEMTKDISAPGSDIYSTFNDQNKTAAQNNIYYNKQTGTSMAAPQVAGVMALVFAANPSLTAQQAVSILYSTATDLNTAENLSGTTFDYETGYGMANARDAVALAQSSGYLDGEDAILKGKTTTLHASSTAAVQGATWEWTSSNETVATVNSSGKVTGVSEGTAAITASYRLGNDVSLFSFTKTVTVYDPRINGKSAVALDGTTTFTVSSGVAGTWKWYSTDDDVASVGENNGVVRGVSLGTATIVARLSTNPSIFTTYDVSVCEASIAGNSALMVGRQEQLVVESGVAGEWEWASSNEAVATVAYTETVTGRVTGLKAGKTTITASLKGSPGTFVSTEITVYDPKITGVATIKAGGSSQLSVSPTLANGWEWTSSNQAVATVDASTGRVTGVSAGNAVVKATMKDYPAISVSQIMTVCSPVVSGLVSVNVGKTAQLSVSSNIRNAVWTWKSSNKSIASVGSSTGIVKGLKAGKVTITASLAGNTTITAKSEITIKDPSTVEQSVVYSTDASSSASSGTGYASGTAAGSSGTSKKPTWSGATNMPAGSFAEYSVNYGSLRILSDTAGASLSGTTLHVKNAGEVKLALLDSAGQVSRTRTITVYALGGKWRLQSAASAKLYLDVEGASKRNGAQLVTWTKRGKASQKFKFSAKSDGTFAVKSVGSKKLVRVVGKTSKQGASICQKGTKAAKAARWRLMVDESNYITLVNAKSGKALDSESGDPIKGAAAVQWQYQNDTQTQKWILKKA